MNARRPSTPARRSKKRSLYQIVSGCGWAFTPVRRTNILPWFAVIATPMGCGLQKSSCVPGLSNGRRRVAGVLAAWPGSSLPTLLVATASRCKGKTFNSSNNPNVPLRLGVGASIVFVPLDRADFDEPDPLSHRVTDRGKNFQKPAFGPLTPPARHRKSHAPVAE